MISIKQASRTSRRSVLRGAVCAALGAAAFGKVLAQADSSRSRLVLLGTRGGPRFLNAESFPSSNVLVVAGVPYVIDVGYGVTGRLTQAKVALDDVRYVFITHHHSDHNLEYGALVYNAWISSLRNPFRLEAYGPRGMLALNRAAWEANSSDIETRMADEGRSDPRKLIVAREYDEGLVMDNGSVRVTALRNLHPPIHDSFALKFEIRGGQTIVFSGDTAYLPALAEFARGADYLVHEVMDWPAVQQMVGPGLTSQATRILEHLKASHTVAEDVGWIAAQAEAKNLVLTHFVPASGPGISDERWIAQVRKHYAGPVIVGRDLLEIPIR